MHGLERRNEDLLVLHASASAGCIGTGLILIGVGFLISTIYVRAGWFWGLFFLFVGYLARFGPPKTILDRKHDVIKIRRYHFREQYSLSQIEDVRVVHGRTVTPVHSNSNADRAYLSYQIVLSHEDPHVERVPLLENGDRSLQVQYGREIAQFLGVPFFDDSSESESSLSDTDRTSERHRPTPISPEEAERREKQDRWAAKRAERKRRSSDNRR